MNREKLNKFLKYILFIIFCLFCMTGCSLNNEDKTIQDKTNEEIKNLEEEIFTVVNKYTKGEYQSEDKIKWQDVNDDAQKINDVLDTIMLDLSEVNISNEELITLRNEINNILIAISNEDEKVFLDKISYVYSLLPTYLEKYEGNDKNKVNIMKLKSLVLSSFSFCNSLEWEDAKSTVISAENKYKEMMDDVDFMKEHSYNLNKIYILLEEFKNAVNLEELELSKQKYISFIEKIGD